MTRPLQLLTVLGTGTDVGKTWVACGLLEHLRAEGFRVAARKPAQSWDPDDLAGGRHTDAVLLAAATGERAEEVCPPQRSYPVPLAPPMAAERLGLPAVALADLVADLRWPAAVDFGVVEGAGGTRSPLAGDGDGVDLVHCLEPDLVVLVASAELGTLHAVRSALDGLTGLPVVVMLNRFDPASQLHAENAAWLSERCRLAVVTSVLGLVELVQRSAWEDRSSDDR